MRKAHLTLLLPAVLLAQQAPKPLRTIHLPGLRLTLQVPPDWPTATHDRELSTFHDEARTAPRTARLHFVAAMPENPYPESTFSGAHLYVSATPSQTALQCAAQASPASPATQVANRPTAHAHDEHGTICTQFRDETYTLRRGTTCLRFDLALNNFCGGEVSGVRDLTPAQIQAIQSRLKSILDTVRLDP